MEKIILGWQAIIRYYCPDTGLLFLEKLDYQTENLAKFKPILRKLSSLECINSYMSLKIKSSGKIFDSSMDLVYILDD